VLRYFQERGPRVVLLLLTIAACSPYSGQRRAPSLKRVEVRDQGFEVSVPSTWERIGRNPERFKSSDNQYELTVTSFRSTVPMDQRKRGETLSALLDHRLAAERRAMGDEVVVNPARVQNQETVSRAQYSGMDVRAGHRFATMILVSSTGAWAFFIEGPGSAAAEKEFHDVSTQVFDSVVLLK
jgi:hypothetical protein